MMDGKYPVCSLYGNFIKQNSITLALSDCPNQRSMSKTCSLLLPFVIKIGLTAWCLHHIQLILRNFIRL